MNPFEIEMIRTYADCDMNQVQTAKILYVHKNTVQYHLDLIKRKTGLNPKKFSDLVELLARIDRGEFDEKAD